MRLCRLTEPSFTSNTNTNLENKECLINKACTSFIDLKVGALKVLKCQPSGIL